MVKQPINEPVPEVMTPTRTTDKPVPVEERVPHEPLEVEQLEGRQGDDDPVDEQDED